MQSKVRRVFPLLSPSKDTRSGAAFYRISLLAGSLLLAAAFIAGHALSAQALNQITQKVDVSRVQVLPNHHPQWASTANSAGLTPADLPLNQLTLVLARSPQQEQAFEQFLADQQNPASPDFHHWLTPAEVGERYGLSDQDIATITGWLQSQGLQVNWVAPSRIFIGFGGTAANVGRAFQTEMQYYSVRGEQKLSVSSDPMVPASLLPAIKGVRGLYTIDERPTHRVSTVQTVSPQLTVSGGVHYVTPADFNTIYDVPSAYTGAGITIGIVSWSHTYATDFDNFKSKTGVTFTDPTEIVPTAFGGIDPGPALTAPPTGSSSVLGAQEEATLDVIRAGSVAPGANLLLVVSSASGTADGIGADAQYMINTSPVPVQVISISFGACESSAGAGNVAFWDNLFQTAASEGISVFVSSGDSGAAGCDTAFSAPPSVSVANSPNYICSSSYATCVGGTQFADTASPSTYWSSSNSTGYQSVLSYIPEGAWNESTTTNVAGTGGGVSTVIATPSWQSGTGVPSARTGRYTPDVSFTAANHDGYFACLAAISGGGCVTSNNSFGFVIFSGTSASAPGMAGVAALLDQKLGSAQGNLNLQLYPLAASVPAAYHDTTVFSSGVSDCSATTASLCNNSVTLLSGSGAQAGFTVGTGYDEATGLGSLDVAVFLNNYTAAGSAAVPGFTAAGTAVTVTAGATTGSTSTITITPTNRFTGSVTMTAAITSSPSGAQYPPTLSFTPNPVSITSTSAVTSTLTVSTTASQTSPCTAFNQAPRGIPWYAQGGAVLACVLLFGIAPRRRKWRAIFGMLMLFVALAGGMLACGGGSNTSACSTAITPGTTAGSYTIAVTGTSGSTSVTNTIALTVN